MGWPGCIAHPNPAEHVVNVVSTCAGHGRFTQDPSVARRPVVKRQPFPEAAPRVRWAPTQQALITAIPPALTDNFG